MAYSESTKTLDKIRPLLINLELGVGDLFTAPAGMSAKVLAYKIREALYIASRHPEQYPELARAAQIFKVQILNRTQVQAVLTDKQTLAKVTVGGAVEHGAEIAGPLSPKMMGQQTAGSIIEHVLKLQRLRPSNDQMQFPQANLNREERLRLHTWCQAQTPKWLMLVADEQITLTRPTRNITEDLAWNPEDDE